MTNPGPLGGDDRPLTGPDADLFAAGEVPPAAVPAAPAYEPTELLEPTPAYDSLAEESALDLPLTAVVAEPLTAEPLTAEPLVVEPLVVEETDYLAEPPVQSGPLAAVKAFAAERPAVYLGAALAAGWLVGKIFSSSDDE